MLDWLFRLGILFLLLYGSYTDLRTRTVSNKVTGGVILLSLPLIYMAWGNLTSLHIAYSVLILFMYYKTQGNGFGGADVKAMIPIMLTMSISSLIVVMTAWIFASVCVAILLKSNKIPFFVPMTVGYIIYIVTLIYQAW